MDNRSTTYVILGGRLGKDDSRILDYELAVGDPVNVIIGSSQGAPVYEQRVVKSLAVELGCIMVETGVGKRYCPFCDVWDDHDVLECRSWIGDLSENERREVVLQLSRESMNANWERTGWVVEMQRAVKEKEVS